MKRDLKSTLLACFVCGVFGAAGTAFAQDSAPAAPAAPAAEAEKLPSGKEVIERFIAATGGREAYDKLKNRVTKGTIEIPMMGMKGTMQITQAHPNMMVTSTEFTGMGLIRNGTNGEVVWDVNSMMGPRIVEGDEKVSFMRQATFNSELQWEKLYKSVEVVGVEDVNGKPAYKLKMVPNDGPEGHQFYDKESGLMVKTSTIAKSQMGDVPVEGTLEDYREVDGIKMAFRTTQQMGPNSIVIALEEVKHNVDLPAETFALPDEIQKLKDAAQPPAANP